MAANQRDRIFVSYSHKDTEWLDRLREVLAPDIRNNRVDYWDDRELQPGDPWYAKILEGIGAARVAVLLVSPNFLASRFIMEEEIPRILSACGDGLTVLWIPLFGAFSGPEASPLLEPILGLQSAFGNRKPLAELDAPAQGAQLLELCRHIERLLNPRRIPSNLPFSSLAELFKGRDAALAQLDRTLRQHGSAAVVQPQAIHGLGGIGKTRLAIEYAWRHQNEFTAFLFVSANTPDDLNRNLAALCRPDCLDLRESQSPKQEEQRDAVIRWLQQNKRWLLILDNVDTDEGVRAVKALVAKLHGGQVIITSRVTEWGRGVRPLALDVLPLEDAVELLVESAHGWRAPRPDDTAQARILADHLGCLPLALTHATAYMQHHHRGFPAYLDDFEQHFERLLAYHDHLAIEYETELSEEGKELATPEAKAARKKFVKTVATTFFLSFDRLTSEAKAILQAAAFLASDPIPISMFEHCPGEVAVLVNLWCEDLSESKSGQTVADALAELARYSLISRDDGVFSVHRMEQLVLRNRPVKKRMPTWIEGIRAVLCKYAPDETAENPKTWPVWDVLRPHAEALVAQAKADDGIQPHLGLLISIGQLYFGKALYTEDLAVDELALKVAEALHGAESDQMANRLLSYGETLRVLGRNKDAEGTFRRSLAIREKNDGPESYQMASDLNYVALALRDQGKDDEAEALYRRSIAIFELRNNNDEKHEYAKPLSNLAALLGSKDGMLDESEALLRKALKLNEESIGAVHPKALICVGVMAQLLAKKGDLSGAESLFQQALSGFEQVLGADHPRTLHNCRLYADFLETKNDLSQAESLYRRILEVEERKLGRNHPDTLTTVNNLGVLLFKKKEYVEAESLYRRVLDELNRIKGEEPPDTLAVVGNLADSFEECGRMEEALALRQRAVEAQERILGPENLDTLRSLNKQSVALRRHGYVVKAEPIGRKLAEKTTKVLGSTHPLAVHRRNNLAITLIMLGKLEEADQILAASWRLDAPPHANTTPCIVFLRYLCARLGSQADTRCLGQLKALLTGPKLPVSSDVASQWDIAYFIEYLRPKLPPDVPEFLATLVAALNDRIKLPQLDHFPEWRDQGPLPLETQWPES
jgi:tetratricopeptide (TPR) repeat protein